VTNHKIQQPATHGEINRLIADRISVLTSGLLWVLSETGASNWQITGDFFCRTANI